MENEFERSPGMSYKRSLGCGGSDCCELAPLVVFSPSGLFLLIGLGFLKLVAPAVLGVTFGCTFLDWDLAWVPRAGFAPLRPREDVECARCLLLVAGLRAGLLPRERGRI